MRASRRYPLRHSVRFFAKELAVVVHVGSSLRVWWGDCPHGYGALYELLGKFWCVPGWPIIAPMLMPPLGIYKIKGVSGVLARHLEQCMSTMLNCFVFKLDGLPERELKKLKAAAVRVVKISSAFAFYMDRQKKERERDVITACTIKELCTYTEVGLYSHSFTRSQRLHRGHDQ